MCNVLYIDNFFFQNSFKIPSEAVECYYNGDYFESI